MRFSQQNWAIKILVKINIPMLNLFTCLVDHFSKLVVLLFRRSMPTYFNQTFWRGPLCICRFTIIKSVMKVFLQLENFKLYQIDLYKEWARFLVWSPQFNIFIISQECDDNSFLVTSNSPAFSCSFASYGMSSSSRENIAQASTKASYQQWWYWVGDWFVKSLL